MRYVDSNNGLQVNLRPYITAFNPASSIDGAPIQIDGGNFFGITGIRFNGLAARYTVPSSTRINVTVPFGATTGTVTLIQGCSSYHSPQPFTVLP